MNFDSVVADIRATKLAGRRFEREGHGKFRDCVTVCRNGRFKFERYCYGEAASLVCTMYAEGADADGAIQWQYEKCGYTGKDEAPVALTGYSNGSLYFDEKRWAWQPAADLKTVPDCGLGKLSMLLGK